MIRAKGTALELSKSRLRALRSLQFKKGREKQGKFIIEGVRLIGEALAGDAAIDLVVGAQDLSEEGRRLLVAAQRKGVEVVVVERDALRAISPQPTPPGALAVVKPRTSEWKDWLEH